MKAIINIRYSDNVAASIRYFSNRKKVVKFLDGLNIGVAKGKPKDIEELLLAGHHDPYSCKAARTFIISVETPKNATPRQLKKIDDGLEKAFFDLKKHMGNSSMLGWIHGNTDTRHLHGLGPNSDGKRGLNLSPQWLKELQSFFGLMLLKAVGAKAKERL